MLGLFGTLNLASGALSVAQEESAVTGQNLANVNNTAYARQQVNVATATPLQTSIGDEGTGVQAVSITEVRSSILDSQIQSEGSVTGSLTAQQNALDQAEAELGEQISSSAGNSTDTSATGLTADLSSLFSSFQSLSTDPSNLSDRQAVVQSAQQLTGQFNSVSSGLATVQADLNTSIQNDVASSNQDLNDIAALNQQIVQATAGGGTANDLVDQREQDLEDLAGKVNFTATTQSNGAVDVSIGGVTMVSGADTPDSLQAFKAANGNTMVQAQNAGTTLSLSGGSIEGAITTRDGALASLQSSVNTVASQLITQVNSIYSNGFDLNGNTGADLFTGSDAATIGVNSTVVNDPSTFQASGTQGDSGDNTVILQLAQLANQPLAGLNNQTISQNYAQTVGAFGSAISTVNDQLTNSGVTMQMLSNQRNSLGGVSTDQEMTNLMQFQKAYEASSVLITTVNEMLETLITMKTE
jgi:flagellar hook-associated protein 1 FlgK